MVEPKTLRQSKPTLEKCVLFKCGRCLRLITISDPSLLTVYKGHFYCMRCRKAGGYRCANQQEERALHSEEICAGPSLATKYS
jgi:hypothetical protein